MTEIQRDSNNQILDTAGDVLAEVALKTMTRIQKHDGAYQAAAQLKAENAAQGRASYGATARMGTSGMQRDAVLWKGYVHYQGNREAYQQQALEEAVAAGVQVELEPGIIDAQHVKVLPPQEPGHE